MQNSTDILIEKLLQLPISHLVFLLTFDPPRTVERFPNLSSVLPHTDWDEFLKESPLQVTESLLELGALIRSDLRKHLDYFFTKADLQRMLKELNLPLSGNKLDLIDKLVRADQNELWNKMGNRRLLECTPWAWSTAETYLDSIARSEIKKSSKHSTEDVEKVIKWILLAAASGVIGNRVDATLKTLIENILQKKSILTPGTTPNIPGPASPRVLPEEQTSLFKADFEYGYPKDMQVIAGTIPPIINGELRTNQWFLFWVGDTSWNSYEITVKYNIYIENVSDIERIPVTTVNITDQLRDKGVNFHIWDGTSVFVSTYDKRINDGFYRVVPASAVILDSPVFKLRISEDRFYYHGMTLTLPECPRTRVYFGIYKGIGIQQIIIRKSKE